MTKRHPAGEHQTRQGDRGPNDPPRILFYSPDSFGLGHIRRTLSIATAVSERLPNAALLALTGSLAAHAFELPHNFDYVKLPAVTKGPTGAYTSYQLPISFADCRSLRERIIVETSACFSPHVVLVDHAPLGLDGELGPTLHRIRTSNRDVRLVLGLRDIIDDPKVVRDRWRSAGLYDALDDMYDMILVYGDRQVFDPVLEYAFTPAAAAKTRFCGYIRKPRSPTSIASVRSQLGAESVPLVVVTVGGGGDGATLIEAYLAGLRESKRTDHASCIITGPLIPGEEHDRITAAAAGLPNIAILRFTADLGGYLDAADLVISMGGYNTVSEIMALGKRSIVIPRVHPRREQLIRAERLAARGLISFIHPDALTPDRLMSSLQSTLASSPPSSTHAFPGLQLAATALLGELAQVNTAPQLKGEAYGS